MAIVSWKPYDLPVIPLGTNEIGGLASGGLSVASAAIYNDQGRIYCDIEFVAGAAMSPLTNAAIDLWMLRSIDGGLSYEDGSASAQPSRDPDVSIPVRAGAGILPRSGAPQLVLPPATYKVMIRNRTGTSIPAGSVIRLGVYTEAAS